MFEFFSNPIVWIVALLVLVAAGGAYAFFRWRKARRAAEEADRPLLSLVLLFRELPYLDATVLGSIAKRAWDIEVLSTGADDDSPQDSPDEAGSIDTCAFIVGEPPTFIVKHPDAFLLVNCLDQPYWDDSEAVAKDFAELRTRDAILQHTAWISADIMGDATADEQKKGYRVIGRLLAELADDNVLAVLDVAGQQIFCYDPETERKLRSDNPLAELREMYYSPIISVSADDPEMQAAVAEARKRWPEFVAAFESRDPSAELPFMVKAPFGHGDDVEFMWVAVTSIENNVIYGTLENEPHNIPGLNVGDRVTAQVENLNDWLCVKNDEPVGGFTMKVLSERAKEGAPEDEED